MRFLLTMNHLTNCFDKALEEESKYIGILIQRHNLKRPELIINPAINFESKLSHFKKAYNEDLTLKVDEDVKIIGFTHADSFDEIQALLVLMYHDFR